MGRERIWLFGVETIFWEGGDGLLGRKRSVLSGKGMGFWGDIPFLGGQGWGLGVETPFLGGYGLDCVSKMPIWGGRGWGFGVKLLFFRRLAFWGETYFLEGWGCIFVEEKANLGREGDGILGGKPLLGRIEMGFGEEGDGIWG